MESPSVCIKKITFYANFSSFYMIVINLSPVWFSHKKAAHPDGHTSYIIHHTSFITNEGEFSHNCSFLSIILFFLLFSSFLRKKVDLYI